jgi:hypothetical protein
MTETRPDALTELVRILREQLTRKDERIANLETLLKEANLRLEEQQRLLEYLLGKENPLPAAPKAAQQPLPAYRNAPPVPPTSPPAAPSEAVAPEPPVSSSPPQETGCSAAPTQERPPIPISALISPIPGMGEMIQATAEQVISAAQSKEEESCADGEEKREITARFQRDQLRKGHREHEARNRGLWRRLFSRSEPE